MPQVAASLVAARLRSAPDAALALAGQGVRDVTRIAASDPELWTQILGGNAGAVAPCCTRCGTTWTGVVGALDALAAEPARRRPGGAGSRGRAGRRRQRRPARIPGKHGAPHTAYAAVPVLVPDRPGELARLLHDVGAAGVNLEDLRLEHSQGQPVGLAEVLVVPSAAQVLVAALRERGWVVHEPGLA